MARAVKPQEMIESVVLAAVVIALCFYINPNDPLLVHGSFPWLWLLPVLISLSYGRFCGGVVFLFIFLAMIRSFYTTLIDWDTYRSWLLGGFILTILCGEYQAKWLRKQFSLDRKTDYLNTRIQSLSRAYGVLRFSHDRLEESLIVRPVTLRQSFARLRELAALNQGLNERTATQYLELVASYANLEVANLYIAHKGKLALTSIASIGKSEPLVLNDKLVQRCLRGSNTSYIAVNKLYENELSHYLAVVMMKQANGELFGVLTITDMPFMSLNEETLKSLQLVLSYIADEASAAEQAIEITATYSDCPPMFASELYKLKHISIIAELPTTVSAYYIDDDPKKNDIIYTLIQQKRTIDIIWQTKRGDKTVLLILMPLSGRSMLTGYRDRINNLLQKTFEITLGKPPVLFRYQEVSDFKDPKMLITELLDNV